VATMKAWKKNPQMVAEFYNKRRREMDGVQPNDAHLLIAELEKAYDVTVVTQNVDNLHEKAGSSNVIHLHGRLDTLRTEHNRKNKKPYTEDLIIGDISSDGGQWRPDVVWFGESLLRKDIDDAYFATWNSYIFIIIGTSMQVSPANELPWQTPDEAQIYYIDPSEIGFEIPKYRQPYFKHIQKKATEGMADLIKELI